jgi:hypothetical protein
LGLLRTKDNIHYCFLPLAHCPGCGILLQLRRAEPGVFAVWARD